jgi:hypothetical protein
MMAVAAAACSSSRWKQILTFYLHFAGNKAKLCRQAQFEQTTAENGGGIGVPIGCSISSARLNPLLSI